MRTEILTAAQLDVLGRLKALPSLGAFYLAGGTALALRLGHRRSVDFDFFTAGDFDASDLRGRLADLFGEAPLRTQAPRTLYVTLLGVTTSFFAYRYPLLEAPDPTAWGFGLARTRDIAAMKLEAIASRGSRKDFVDLYFLCRELDLRDVFRAFEDKFGAGAGDAYHRLRALTWFADAEAQPMPEMLAPADWPEIRRFFEQRAHALFDEGETR